MSTQSVTPVGMVIGPVMNALLAPLVVNRTECPEAHPVSAAWIRPVSRVVSLGTPPPVTVSEACKVVHAGGIVGSAGRFGSPAHVPVPPSVVTAPLLLLLLPLELLLVLPPLELLLLLPASFPGTDASPLLLPVPASLAPLLLLPLELLLAEPLLPLLPLLEPLPELPLLLLEVEPLPEEPPVLLPLEPPGSGPSVVGEEPQANGPSTHARTPTTPNHRFAIHRSLHTCTFLRDDAGQARATGYAADTRKCWRGGDLIRDPRQNQPAFTVDAYLQWRRSPGASHLTPGGPSRHARPHPRGHFGTSPPAPLCRRRGESAFAVGLSVAIVFRLERAVHRDAEILGLLLAELRELHPELRQM